MRRSNILLSFSVALAITFSLAQCAHAQTISFLTKFTGKQTSAIGVIQATDGNFYGVTSTGGAYDKGQVFQMTPTGELSTIYSFCAPPYCTDGGYPESVPILGSDGDLYGVASEGGNHFAGQGAGTVWKMTLDGQLTTLYTFCPTTGCADGVAPASEHRL